MSMNSDGTSALPRWARRLLSGAASCVLLGCSTVPMTTGTALAQTDAAPDEPGEQPTVMAPVPAGDAATTGEQSSMDGQLMFEIMIAELAGRRGQLDVAMAGYLRASERTDDPRVSERATRLAMFGRQWAEAEKAGRRWLQLDPDAPEANEILAQALMRQDKTAEAVEIYQRLIEQASDPDAVLRQVLAELQSVDDPRQALQVMKALMPALEDNAQAYLALASLQLNSNDREAALVSAEAALKLDPDSNSALLLKAQLLIVTGRPDEAFAAVESVLAEHPDKLTLRLGYAQLLVEAGRFDNVGEQLDQLYANAPDDPDTLLTISMLALDARRMDRARTYLTSLQETGEYADQANFYLARISDQQKDYETAIGYYEAVTDGELRFNAQVRLAELLGMSGQLEAGREKLREMAGTVPDPAMQTQLLTAESRMLQQAGQAPEAVKVLTEGLSRFPNDADLLYARALAADVAGNQDMLVADLETLIDSDPDNAHALNALGYHYANENIELSRAEELLVKANELLPNDPAIMDSLGWLRYRQGQFEPAITLLKVAYEMYPDPEIAAHLGEVLWLNGNEEEARKLVEEALLQSPDDVHLLQVLQKYIE